MQYITYQNMDALLKSYSVIKGALQTIQMELNHASGITENDVIESMALKHIGPSDTITHSPGTITDKTANTAIGYENKLENENKALINELTKELMSLKLITDKLEIGLNSLSETQKSIIDARYFQKLDWYAVIDKLAVDKMFLSKYQAQNIRRQAIEKLMQVTRITVTQYETVMRLINLKRAT
ncbi:MAG TPA: hypothetical protein VFF25_02880 [Clostridia bacterium]|nr:hypothetical protein [Clostridia bacterium]